MMESGSGSDAPDASAANIIPLVSGLSSGLDLDTPLQLVNRRVRCTQCGQRTVKIRAEPYNNLTKR